VSGQAWRIQFVPAHALQAIIAAHRVIDTSKDKNQSPRSPIFTHLGNVTRTMLFDCLVRRSDAVAGEDRVMRERYPLVFAYPRRQGYLISSAAGTGSSEQDLWL
jgi:hypothetical protein